MKATCFETEIPRLLLPRGLNCVACCELNRASHRVGCKTLLHRTGVNTCIEYWKGKSASLFAR